MKRSKDKFLKTDPCEIIIQHCHNHPLDAVENLRFRRPKPEVVEKFHELFRNKHSPSSALKTHLFDIRVNHPDNWFEVLADRAQCPTLQWCFHQFYKQFKEAYGSPDGEEMLKSLNEAILKFNADCESECASMKVIDKDLVVVICSPLLKRVHLNLKSSGEMAFLDSGGCMDRHGTRVFTFLAPECCWSIANRTVHDELRVTIGGH